MEAFYESTRRQTMILGMIYLVLGIIFVCRPDSTFSFFSYAFAIVLLIIGISKVVIYLSLRAGSIAGTNGLAVGLILAVIGMFLILKPSVTEGLVGYALALTVLFGGIIELQNAIDLRSFGQERWKVALGLAVVFLILGIIALADPFAADTTLVIMVGITLLIEAFGYLLSFIFMTQVKKNIYKDPVDSHIVESGDKE